MNLKTKNVYKSYLLEYFHKVNPDLKISEKKLFQCPLKCSEEPTAQYYQNNITCQNPACKKNWDIFQYVKLIKPNLIDSSEEEIGEYLSHLLKIEIIDDSEELLKRYQQAGFALIPLSPNSKVPLKGQTEWQKTDYRNIDIWKDWIGHGYNIGVNLGIPSNIMVVDIDADETYEKVKHLLGNTLIQTTGRGRHFIYNYDPDFKKTLNKVLRQDKYEMELRTTGAYIVVAPSVAYNGDIRKWNNEKISDMPKELKEFLMKYHNASLVPEQTPDDEIQEAINSENLGVIDLSGQRNVTFTKLAGIFRKKLNVENTEYVLNVISNSLIDKPLPKHELRAIVGQVAKYNTYDKIELSKTILGRLDIVKEASAFQLASSMKLEQKDVENVLHYLENENKIIAIGGNRYKKLNDIEWGSNLTEELSPLDFSVPYFSKYAHFNWKELMIIGGQTGSGKSVITGNLMKGLIEQKVTPYLISTEATSTIGKTLTCLGVKPGEYKYKIMKSALGVEFPDNAVIILDWLGADQGDFTKMAVIYEHLYEQVKKHNCFLIVMEQLKKTDNNFFAQNLNMFYASLVAKYQYGNGGADNINTFFKTEKIRDSRTGQQYITIPTVFNPITRKVDVKG